TLTSEPSGANCPGGGQKVSVGLDANGNSQLDVIEVTQVGYVCNESRARVVFLSSATYNGNMGGYAGADAKCQALAAAVPALAPKTFAAWISTSASSPS